MIADRARDLWTRFLEGEDLSPEEEAELLEGLREDESLRREFVEDDRMVGLLEGVERSASDVDDFAEAFSVRLEAERNATGFINRVRLEMSGRSAKETKRITRSAFRRHRGAAPTAGWKVFLVAAGILLAFGVIFLAALPSRPVAPPDHSAQKPSDVVAPTPPVPRSKTPDKPEAPKVEPRPTPPRPAPVPSRPEKAEPKPPSIPKRTLVVAPPAPAADRPEPRKTRVAAAVVAKVSTGAGELRDLKVGEAVEVRDPKGSAKLSFPDGTTIRLEGEGRLADVRAEGGKRMRLEAGTIEAVVTRQADPMVIETAHGRATVLGTTFLLEAGKDTTRLEVYEGRVRLTREPRSVEVRGGSYAVAGEGVVLRSRPLPSSEIVLLPKEGRLVGADWAVVADPDASSGVALETRVSRQTPTLELLNQLTSWVEFEFYAEGEKTYAVWVRGRAPAAQNRLGSDAVNVRPLDAVLTRPDGRSVEERMNFNGYANRPGYWWVGGDGDLFGPQGKRMSLNPVAGARHGDEIPLRVRFAKTGRQTLRIYANESPMRIDAVWLSRTRTSRPADTRKAPAEK